MGTVFNLFDFWRVVFGGEKTNIDVSIFFSFILKIIENPDRGVAGWFKKKKRVSQTEEGENWEWDWNVGNVWSDPHRVTAAM